MGGAQRVISRMAAHWVAAGHDVTLLTTLCETADFYPLPAGVRRVTLVSPDAARSNWRRGLITRMGRWFATLVPSHWLAVLSGSCQPLALPSGADNRHGSLWSIVVTAIRVLACGLLALIRVAQSVVNLGRALLRRASDPMVKRIRDAAFPACARYRLLGSSHYPYALVLRLRNWRVRALRDVLSELRPDVVMSLLGSANIMTISASVGMRHRLIISERNDPTKQRLNSPWEELRPIIYPKADVISANTEEALGSMQRYCPQERLVYMPNPLIFGDAVGGGSRSKSLLFLGRLVHQKGPDILIDSFARFSRAVPDWRLEIAGDGPLGDELRARVRKLGLAERVIFHGAVDDPAPLLASCDIFVLASRFEGTPNALLEAMAHRMCCIVTDASPGPLKLIDDGVSGLVVRTECVESLSNAMSRLALDERLRVALGAAAFDRVQEFGLESVASIWDQILFPDGAASHRTHASLDGQRSDRGIELDMLGEGPDGKAAGVENEAACI